MSDFVDAGGYIKEVPTDEGVTKAFIESNYVNQVPSAELGGDLSMGGLYTITNLGGDLSMGDDYTITDLAAPTAAADAATKEYVDDALAVQNPQMAGAAGTNQSDATQLSASVNPASVNLVMVTTTAGQGVKLPDPGVEYMTLRIVNSSSVALLVYPNDGYAINGEATNAAVSLAAESILTIHYAFFDTWYGSAVAWL
jgi:hypothetical protein